jgi:hypothetical protein
MPLTYRRKRQFNHHYVNVGNVRSWLAASVSVCAVCRAVASLARAASSCSARREALNASSWGRE